MSDQRKKPTGIFNEDIPQARHQIRMTNFLCREMMYDYLTGRLDELRFQAMQEYIEKNKSMQVLESEVRSTLQHIESYGEIPVVDSILLALSDDLQPFFKRWSLPKFSLPQLGWKPVFFFFSVFFLAGLIVGLFPKSLKEPFQSTDVRLLESNIELVDISAVFSSAAKENIPITNKVFEHDRTLWPSKLLIFPAWPEITILSEHSASSALPDDRREIASEGGLISEEEALVQKASEDEASAEFQVDSSSDPVETPLPEPQGVVTRLFMSHSSPETIGESIRDKIHALGGARAGEVELGWRAWQYYHFALPEDQTESFLSFLDQFGIIRISRDPHPRVMPEGESRFILLIEVPESRN